MISEPNIPHAPRENKPVKRVRLEHFSPSNKGWDKRKKDASEIEAIYDVNPTFGKLAARMRDCSQTLGFQIEISEETGEIRHRLRKKHSCHVRHCPICSSAKGWHASQAAEKKLPSVLSEHEPLDWLFLTLTVKNPPMGGLGDKIRDMNKAWARMTHLKSWPALGWLRAVEVTKGKDGNPHPHFHVLLCVPKSYFSGRGYIGKERWLGMWQGAMRDDSIKIVDIRKVKDREVNEDNDFSRTLGYVVKYATKIDDAISSPNFLYGLTVQLKGKRFLATGGILKGLLKKQDLKAENRAHDFVVAEERVAAQIEAEDAPKAAEITILDAVIDKREDYFKWELRKINALTPPPGCAFIDDRAFYDAHGSVKQYLQSIAERDDLASAIGLPERLQPALEYAASVVPGFKASGIEQSLREYRASVNTKRYLKRMDRVIEMVCGFAHARREAQWREEAKREMIYFDFNRSMFKFLQCPVRKDFVWPPTDGGVSGRSSGVLDS